ncbi:WD40-like Beta Propeller Repeat [Mucilaginibacter polytrichastri]|uniref:OmpA family protein n=1 Tax=Mucilaginibacter polytrichastri TaxID=1302689 RepID=UPI0008F1BAE1|nr:OmpA family protein [Mucilaginibacter polytrichastri]SFS59986.1 WD40-like Beta Propeller Repeat [Mucilaginibacter polytrichastri]
MVRVLFTVLFFIAFPCTLFAQQRTYTTQNTTAIKYYAIAGSSYDYRKIDDAIASLLQATEADDHFIEAHIFLADMYGIKKQYKEATEHYQKAITLNPEFSQAVYIKISETEISLGRYKDAQMHLLKYLSYPYITDKDRFKAKKLMGDCDFALLAMQHPVPFTPVNMGPEINTTDDEYLPTATADESMLIFTRKINNNEDFYKSARQNCKWQTATYLSKNINTPNYNEGAQSLSQDGKYLFFTGCNRPDGLGKCDIYVSQKKGNDWSTPFDLSRPLNTQGWESQPSISADGRTLYFVSNRKGGYGGYDIWKSTLNATGWGEPENLGPTINTAFDEQSPFIHPDDSTLYFCSNGWPGMGNKDLYISRLGQDGKWQKPQNLGYPINSSGDENGLTISTNGSYAYFSSNNLNGVGGYDIYMFELPAALKPKLVTYVKGRVTDAKTKQPIESIVEIIDLEKNDVVYHDVSSATDGDFLATLTSGKNYGLNISREGYLFYSENFSLVGHAPTQPFIVNVALSPIEIGKKVILNNIFFDSNKYELKTESKAELGKIAEFLTANPTVKIEISGHTDDTGNDQLNQTLSENRAKSVYQYLVANGTNAAKLVFKGYGKTQPLAPNTNEENKAKNRRTEFKIIAK